MGSVSKEAVPLLIPSPIVPRAKGFVQRAMLSVRG